MIKEITRIDIGLIGETGKHHIEVEVSMDKAIEEDHITVIITAILEKDKIMEDKIIEVDKEGIIDAIILEEVGVGLDQVQELAPTEIELDAIIVGNMVILLRTVQLCK